MTTEPKKGRPRGFAVISKERQLEIARMGARAAREKGVAYQWTPETAKAARAKSPAPTITSENAKELGSRGGKARAAKKAEQETPK